MISTWKGQEACVIFPISLLLSLSLSVSVGCHSHTSFKPRCFVVNISMPPTFDYFSLYLKGIKPLHLFPPNWPCPDCSNIVCLNIPLTSQYKMTPIILPALACIQSGTFYSCSPTSNLSLSLWKSINKTCSLHAAAWSKYLCYLLYFFAATKKASIYKCI